MRLQKGEMWKGPCSGWERKCHVKSLMWQPGQSHCPTDVSSRMEQGWFAKADETQSVWQRAVTCHVPKVLFTHSF